MNLQNPFQTKIGLALGGGGARGVAHIGVLKAMSESEHKIDSIAGTSVGALVATLYAFGLDWMQIKNIFSSLSISRVGILSLGTAGLMDGAKVAELIKEHVGDVDIADAKIPLAIVCCDLISGQNVVFTEGPAPLLVQASGAFPGLFQPVEYKGMLLVDGFLTENVPISAVKKLKSNFVIAVRLGAKTCQSVKQLSIKSVLNRSFDILVDRPATGGAYRPAYTIDLDMSFVDRFKVSDIEKSIDLGYMHTKAMLRKSLLYWSLRPFGLYIYGIYTAVRKLMASLLQGPGVQLPGFQKRQIPQQEEREKVVSEIL